MKRQPVAAERDQDKWLTRLMTRPVRLSGACLDADTLAAWADGALRGRELEAAELHASQCSRCLALVAALGRTMPDPVEPAKPRGALFRWLVPLAAAATAVAIWVAVPDQQRTPALREAVPVAPAPAGEPAPAPAPVTPRPTQEVVQPKVLPQQAPSARVDELQVQSRAEAIEPLDAAQAPPAAPEFPPAPSPPAATQALPDTAASARRSLATPEPIEATAVDPLIRWRVLSGTDIERSTDGGQTWIKTASPPGPIVAIRDVDALRATVTTADGRTLSTADGGATWAPVQEKPAAPF